MQTDLTQEQLGLIPAITTILDAMRLHLYEIADESWLPGTTGLLPSLREVLEERRQHAEEARQKAEEEERRRVEEVERRRVEEEERRWVEEKEIWRVEEEERWRVEEEERRWVEEEERRWVEEESQRIEEERQRVEEDRWRATDEAQCQADKVRLWEEKRRQDVDCEVEDTDHPDERGTQPHPEEGAQVCSGDVDQEVRVSGRPSDTEGAINKYWSEHMYSWLTRPSGWMLCSNVQTSWWCHAKVRLCRGIIMVFAHPGWTLLSGPVGDVSPRSWCDHILAANIIDCFRHCYICVCPTPSGPIGNPEPLALS
jgi:hypothetical protein